MKKIGSCLNGAMTTPEEPARAPEFKKAETGVLNVGMVRTADLGGYAYTDEMTNAVASRLKAD